jgi:hypothetical protein
VPFIRYARDKRGYESTFVMHAYRAANGSSRARVLYVFRSPSGLKVGRRALEAEVTEALEHTHPDLAFDWTALLREPGLPPRVDARDRPYRSSNPRHGGRPEAQHPRPPAEPAPPPVIIEDDSLLGRTVGAREAARLRARYLDLQQRIGRRARTPEDRDRLFERLHRLNPDDWADQAAIQTAVTSIEADWDAVAGELPHRRRGRRGGRVRGDGRSGMTPGSPDDLDGSGIITGEGDPYDDAEQAVQLDHRGPIGDGDGAGDGGRGGPEPDAQSEPEADPAVAGDAGETSATTAAPPDVPGRD